LRYRQLRHRLVFQVLSRAPVWLNVCIDDGCPSFAPNTIRPSQSASRVRVLSLSINIILPQCLVNEQMYWLLPNCDPNTFVKTIDGIRHVVARRPIRSGEEITYDYIIDCHGGIVWQCSCGSGRCRGTIVSSFFELPVELQLEYLPLLNPWFVDEHRSKVNALRKLSKNESSSS